MIALELAPEIESLLQSEALANGCSSEEFAAKLISAHIRGTQPHEAPELFEIKSHADARAWILTRNPHIDDSSRQRTDLRALAHEGHPY